MLKPIQKYIPNIEKFKPLSQREEEVLNAIKYILNKEGSVFIPNWIPLKYLERILNLKKEYRINTRQIQYCIEKLIKKEKIKRYVIFKCKQGKWKKECYYKIDFKRFIKRINENKSSI